MPAAALAAAPGPDALPAGLPSIAVALAAPLLVYLAVLALHLVVPARTVEGYVRGPDGRRLRYRLNGLRVAVVAVGLFVLGARAGLYPLDLFYRLRFEMLASAFVLGLLFTAAIVLPVAPPADSRGLLSDLYLGRLPNPQFFGGRVDAKMYLYLVGAILLELNLLSFAAHHLARHPADPSPGVLLYLALFSFFLGEYLFFEEVHLYTYDFVAERVGFKLGWGCLVFYPFFYGIGLWTVAERDNPHPGAAVLALSAALFFSGWVLSRGANLQKFHFKTRPDRPFLGLLPVALVDGDRRVLVSGFWGLSRHVNYLGEILMAGGLTLSLGFPLLLLPWLYPLYYVALLLPRQLDDDRRCAAKYGPLWAEYQRRVPYRIVPRLW